MHSALILLALAAHAHAFVEQRPHHRHLEARQRVRTTATTSEEVATDAYGDPIIYATEGGSTWSASDEYATATSSWMDTATSSWVDTAAVISETGAAAVISTTPAAVAATPATVAATGTFATSALPTTYTAGATPPVAGAPVLPALDTFVVSNYPPLDRLPPLDSPEVQQWMSEIDWSNVPNIARTGLNGCSNTTFNAAAIAGRGAEANCWWTCGHCTRDTDITFCPNQLTWGMSFDDGPSPSTPKLLQALDDAQLKSTFFVVGSRALDRPTMLQAEYMSGHQISVHTWSHQTLTMLSNEGIVAELGWSKRVIKEILGVTPNTMRPPYGDIDDRVRYIALAMGLTPVIWTTAGTQMYDTQDWQIATGVPPATVLSNFEYIMGNASTIDTGFILLAHDLYEESVDLAVNSVIPMASSYGLTVEPIITCLGAGLEASYFETAGTNMSLASEHKDTVLVTISGANLPSGTGAAGSQGTGSAGKKSAAWSLERSPLLLGVAGFVGGLVLLLR